MYTINITAYTVQSVYCLYLIHVTVHICSKHFIPVRVCVLAADISLHQCDPDTSLYVHFNLLYIYLDHNQHRKPCTKTTELAFSYFNCLEYVPITSTLKVWRGCYFYNSDLTTNEEIQVHVQWHCGEI